MLPVSSATGRNAAGLSRPSDGCRHRASASCPTTVAPPVGKVMATVGGAVVRYAPAIASDGAGGLYLAYDSLERAGHTIMLRRASGLGAAWTPEQALAELLAQRGKQFDAAVVDAFAGGLQACPEPAGK